MGGATLPPIKKEKMATRKKKIVEEVDEIIEATKEETQEELEQSEEPKVEISEPEGTEDVSHLDFRYELKVDATVEKAKEKIEETVKETQIKKEEIYTVKRIEGNNIFAINEKGKYIMLRKQGQYANLKFGDTFSR